MAGVLVFTVHLSCWILDGGKSRARRLLYNSLPARRAPRIAPTVADNW